MNPCCYRRVARIAVVGWVAILSIPVTHAQVECAAWGNIEGIRVDGELMRFESSLCVMGGDWSELARTAKEQQRPRFAREGDVLTITSSLDDLSLTEVVEDEGQGRVTIRVEFTADKDVEMTGAFFRIELPDTVYVGATIDFIEPAASTIDSVSTPSARFGRRQNPIEQASAGGVRVVAPGRRLEVTVNEPTETIIQPGNPWRGNPNTQLYFGILLGNVEAGRTAQRTFTLTVSGDVDREPIGLTIDPLRPGRAFDGIGGNFRLQNAERDPQVIDYCLENLNVTWGRVEMPWREWHPEESVDPVRAARGGRLNQRVHDAMEMARRLARMDIPVIVSAWSAPDWAVIRDPDAELERELRGDPLNPKKMQSIVRSLGAYLIYLKQAYGVEAAMFSFNESDLGINVRQTGEEHADLIMTLGSYLASNGLQTKLLLGDNSDATTYDFVRPAIEDPDAHKYIGGISFHSWRGCDDWTLSIWADAAKTLNVPLFVGEGSTDAAAHRYPAIFGEPSFALNEIDVYVRICAICEARSILQWQLTSDYAVLAGGGMYGNDEPLRPTQRFWNLKQLGSTPAGSFALPIECDRPGVSSAAYADLAAGAYTVHLVNNGAARPATLHGLPGDVKELRIFVTDSRRGMEEGTRVPVSNGTAQFTLDSASFTTLTGSVSE